MECNSAMQPVLEVDQVSVVIDHAPLLDDISLSLHPGEILAIVGANGAGKTTLLHAIAGDRAVSAGQIRVCGRTLKDSSLIQRARCLAVLPQFSLLNFPYSVDEVVALGRIPHSSGAQVDRDIVRQAMEEMDIAYLSGRLYTRLSGGEKQRTQLARVMTQVWRAEDAQPRIILLDEPTSSLDLAHQQQLMKAIKRFSRQHVAVVMVVHDINLAAAYADRILGLCCGRVVCCGPVNEVVTCENLSALFAADFHIVPHPDSNRPVVIS